MILSPEHYPESFEVLRHELQVKESSEEAVDEKSLHQAKIVFMALVDEIQAKNQQKKRTLESLELESKERLALNQRGKPDYFRNRSSSSQRNPKGHKGQEQHRPNQLPPPVQMEFNEGFFENHKRALVDLGRVEHDLLIAEWKYEAHQQKCAQLRSDMKTRQGQISDLRSLTSIFNSKLKELEKLKDKHESLNENSQTELGVLGTFLDSVHRKQERKLENLREKKSENEEIIEKVLSEEGKIREKIKIKREMLRKKKEKAKELEMEIEEKEKVGKDLEEFADILDIFKILNKKIISERNKSINEKKELSPSPQSIKAPMSFPMHKNTETPSEKGSTERRARNILKPDEPEEKSWFFENFSNANQKAQMKQVADSIMEEPIEIKNTQRTQDKKEEEMSFKVQEEKPNENFLREGDEEIPQGKSRAKTVQVNPLVVNRSIFQNSPKSQKNQKELERFSKFQNCFSLESEGNPKSIRMTLKKEKLLNRSSLVQKTQKFFFKVDVKGLLDSVTQEFKRLQGNLEQRNHLFSFFGGELLRKKKELELLLKQRNSEIQMSSFSFVPDGQLGPMGLTTMTMNQLRDMEQWGKEGFGKLNEKEEIERISEILLRTKQFLLSSLMKVMRIIQRTMALSGQENDELMRSIQVSVLVAEEIKLKSMKTREIKSDILSFSPEPLRQSHTPFKLSVRNPKPNLDVMSPRARRISVRVAKRLHHGTVGNPHHTMKKPTPKFPELMPFLQEIFSNELVLRLSQLSFDGFFEKFTKDHPFIASEDQMVNNFTLELQKERARATQEIMEDIDKLLHRFLVLMDHLKRIYPEIWKEENREEIVRKLKEKAKLSQVTPILLGVRMGKQKKKRNQMELSQTEKGLASKKTKGEREHVFEEASEGAEIEEEFERKRKEARKEIEKKRLEVSKKKKEEGVPKKNPKGIQGGSENEGEIQKLQKFIINDFSQIIKNQSASLRNIQNGEAKGKSEGGLPPTRDPEKERESVKIEILKGERSRIYPVINEHLRMMSAFGISKFSGSGDRSFSIKMANGKKIQRSWDEIEKTEGSLDLDSTQIPSSGGKKGQKDQKGMRIMSGSPLVVLRSLKEVDRVKTSKKNIRETRPDHGREAKRGKDSSWSNLNTTSFEYFEFKPGAARLF